MVICLTSSHRIRSFSTYGFHDDYKSKVTRPNVPSQPGIPSVLCVCVFVYIYKCIYTFFFFPFFFHCNVVISYYYLFTHTNSWKVESDCWPDTARSYNILVFYNNKYEISARCTHADIFSRWPSRISLRLIRARIGSKYRYSFPSQLAIFLKNCFYFYISFRLWRLFLALDSYVHALNGIRRQCHITLVVNDRRTNLNICNLYLSYESLKYYAVDGWDTCRGMMLSRGLMFPSAIKT